MVIRDLICGGLLCLISAIVAAGQGTRLLRHPTVSRDQVAFEYAGDLWAVSRSGGEAKRLTSTADFDIDPYFSPDGSQIAFSSTAAGNTDVYVMSSNGGDPRRLTFHPGVDRVKGWTPDGRSIVFSSTRTSAPQEAYFRLWKISADGGQPEPLAPPRAFSGSFSQDGSKLAFDEIPLAIFPV